MNIDFDRLKYSLTGEYEEVMFEKQLEKKDKEIERLNNVIANMEEELMTLYLDIMEYNEDYAKREIKKLKGVDKERKNKH